MKRGLLFTAFAATLLAGPALAQIPNGGFEDWSTPTGATYLDPNGWNTLNALATLGGGQAGCEQGSPGAVGSHYATVTTRNNSFLGILPGLVVLGTQDDPGMAWTTRPATFSAKWQFGIQPQDTGAIVVVFSKWNSVTNSSDAIGGAAAFATGTQAAWQTLNLPIQYLSAENPDSAFILITSSWGDSAKVGSFLKVDALQLSGVATGIAVEQATEMKLYPSPAAGVLNIEAAVPLRLVNVMDMTGKLVLAKGVNASNVQLDVESLAPGRYLLQYETATGTRGVQTFMKQ